jgi:hypothetical protein
VEELLEEVFQIRQRDLLATLGSLTLHSRYSSGVFFGLFPHIPLLVDARESVDLRAVGTVDLEEPYGFVLQVLGRVGSQKSVEDRPLVLLIGVLSLNRVVLVLFRVHSKALSHEFDFDSVDLLDQASDGRQELLGSVPFDIDFEFLLSDLLWGKGLISDTGGLLDLADSIGDEIVHQFSVTLSLVLLSQGNLDVRKTLEISIVGRCSGQLFDDDIVGEVDLSSLHLLADLRQEVVHFHDNIVFGAPTQDVLKHEISHLFTQSTPVSPDHIKTLDLLADGRVRGVPALHGQSGVLLLFQQKETLENAIDFDLELVVLSVDLSFKGISHLEGLLQVDRSGVDHDRISISIDDVETEFTFSNFLSFNKGLSSGPGNQGSDSLGVEPRRGESKASIHRVGSQLEGLLSDIQLLQFDGVLLLFDLLLHSFSLSDQVFQDLGKDRVLDHFIVFLIRKLDVQLLIIYLLFTIYQGDLHLVLNSRAIEVLGRSPLNCGETQVVFLDNRRIK